MISSPSVGSDCPILLAAATRKEYLWPSLRWRISCIRQSPSSVMATEVQRLLVVMSHSSTMKCFIPVPPSSSGAFLSTQLLIELELAESGSWTYQTTTTLFFLMVSTATERGGDGMSNTSTGTFTSQDPWSLLRITLYFPVWDLTGFTM